MMNLKFDKESAKESSEMMPFEQLREIMGVVNNLEDLKKWEDAHGKIEKITEILKELFDTNDLEQSPYWHAYAGSSMKENSGVVDNQVQREIARKIIDFVDGYLVPVVGLENDTYSSALLDDIKKFRDEISKKDELSIFFQDRLQKIVSEIVSEFPEYSVRKIPELNHAVGGSENRFPNGIPSNVVSDVMSLFAIKYRQLREEFIDKSAGVN